MSSIAPASAQRGRFAQAARLAVLFGCGIAVAGCSSAIETVRSLRGIDKNDPDPVTAPFGGNMAAAEAAPYPNLASVPPPPTRATSAAERQKLTDKLIAERTAAQAFASASAASQPEAGKDTAAAAPTQSPQTPTGPAAPPQATAAKEGPAAAVSAPAPAPVRMTAAAPEATAEKHAAPAAQPQPQSAPSPPAAGSETPPAAAHIAAAGDVPRSHGGNAGEQNQALPRDSDLVMPQVRSLPEPDAPRPAPAPPRLSPLPSPAPGVLPAAAIASAAPQPPPTIPELAPIAPPPAPSLGKTEVSRAPAAVTVAMLDGIDPGQVAQVTTRYQESLGSQPPRAVRVIAYTAPPAPGADPLNAYHDALDRAQGVAKALADAGIPEKMIQTEAKSAAGPIAAARVEIQFLP